MGEEKRGEREQSRRTTKEQEWDCKEKREEQREYLQIYRGGMCDR
jgi:hypothetical protein